MKMTKRIFSIVLALVIAAAVAIPGTNVLASRDISEEGYRSYTNTSTKYQAIVDDRADYLTNSEEKKLLDAMKPITEYTNVYFLTDENNRSCTESYSNRLCSDTLIGQWKSSSNSVIYLIDNEYDYIYALNDTYDVITSGKARSITDNVYMFSADEKYYDAGVKAFSQIQTLLEGGKIAQPMKVICNVFIGLFFAFWINYLIVSSKSKLKRAKGLELVAGSISQVNAQVPDVQFTHQTKTYSPRSSGGGGGGHGGHGGGGHHGGGGGHSH